MQNGFSARGWLRKVGFRNLKICLLKLKESQANYEIGGFLQ